MDPPCAHDETDSGFQQFIWDQFDRIYHDFEEFENGLLPNVEYSSHTDFTNISEDNSRLEVTKHQLPKLLQDFHEFEKAMLPPYEMNTTDGRDFIGCNCGGENQENYKRTQNGTEEEGQVHVEGTGDSTKTVDIPCFSGHGNIGGDSGVANPFMKLAKVTSYRVGGGGGGGGGEGGGGVVRSFTNGGFFVQCEGKPNVWRWMGGSARTTSKAKALRRRKRKYKGVYETEAMAALRLERQKINNRAAAAISFERKQAYDVQLQAQIQKLTKENEWRNKMLNVLEGTVMVEIPRKPLKRTISGPM